MIGTTLGSYEVRDKLGEGGMGEVYLAHDTKLRRDVAIKVLPRAFTESEERLARFEREAQLLAQLHHPNIASIFGLEDVGGLRALVMELVQGPTLAERLARGPIPVEETIEIATQVVEALEEAHDKGIVHRDLKPQNIKVGPDGKVKVLDFGLAKAMEQGSASRLQGTGSEQVAGVAPGVSASESPTITSPAQMTRAGVILGTAAYMAPEQARGRPVDKRADVWAFGVVLYEMLTGRRPFDGETVTDTLAAVLTHEPDWTVLPPDTPAGLRRLLRRCLARDRRDRLRDIGDARFELREAADPQPVVHDAASRRRWPWLPWAAAIAIAAVAAAWALWGRTATVPERGVDGHFTLDLPADAPLVTLEIPGVSESPIAVSPDGRQVVYVAPNGTGTRLYARAMSDLTPRALSGTEGARTPFFSPDGQWVAFFAEGKLRKTPLAGGTPVTLAEAPDGYGGAWGPSGEIVFAPKPTGGLFAVADTGGTPRAVTTLDFAVGDDSHRWPQLLPGDRAVLFAVIAWSRETSDIVRVDLSTGARETVLEGVDFARYVPASPGAAVGHLLFVRGGALMAAPFDPAGTEPAGQPVVVVEGVRAGQFDVAASGLLAYTPWSGSTPDYSLVWVTRAGEIQPINDLARGYEDLHLSPDGRVVAATVEEPVGIRPSTGEMVRVRDAPAHVWLADVTRGTLTRFTFEGLSRDPVWMPDGKSIVFGSKRGESTFGLYRQRLDGQASAELLWANPTPLWPDPQSWTPDGRTLAFDRKSKDTGDDIWVLSLDGDRAARPWLQTPANEYCGRLSPDGRWMAYNSEESGTSEVYVQPFPGPGSKWLVSDGGGFNAIWSRDGRELFYRQGNQILKVDVETTTGFTVGKPQVLFAGRYRASGRDFDVSPDGSRFVMMHNDDPRTTTRLNVLLNWWHALEARVSTQRP